jgi:cytochrome c553
VNRAAVAGGIAFLLTAAGIAWSASGPTRDVSSLTSAQTNYLERCGGCHGIQGHSAPNEVPTLQGQVGYFLCTPEARAYLIRLPSVATSPLSDAELAELMNFVVFELGGGVESPARYPRFSDAEVGTLRTRPLKDIALASYRAELVEQLISRCGAPASLRQYSSVQAR